MQSYGWHSGWPFYGIVEEQHLQQAALEIFNNFEDIWVCIFNHLKS